MNKTQVSGPVSGTGVGEILLSRVGTTNRTESSTRTPRITAAVESSIWHRSLQNTSSYVPTAELSGGPIYGIDAFPHPEMLASIASTQATNLEYVGSLVQKLR